MESFKSYIDLIVRFFHNNILGLGLIALLLMFVLFINQIKTKIKMSKSDESIPKRGYSDLFIVKLLSPYLIMFFLGIYLVLYNLGLTNHCIGQSSVVQRCSQMHRKGTT